MSSVASAMGSALGSPVPIPPKPVSLRTQRKKRGRHMSLAQIRGIIRVYKSNFEQMVDGKKRKFSKEVKEQKFKAYKKQLLHEFGRKMAGTLKSEKKFIKLYTDPLTFLTAKNGKNATLDPSKLDPDQYVYYKEIGGTDDVEELFLRRSNVDSMSQAMQMLPQKRRRQHVVALEGEESLASTHLSDEDVLDDFQLPPALSQRIMPPLESSQTTNSKMKRAQPRDAALHQLSDGLAIHEQQLFEKQKREAYQMLTQRMNAMSDHTQTELEKKPQMIGCGIGRLDDQMNIAFDMWIHEHLSEIKERIRDIQDLARAVFQKRQHPDSWSTFLADWKLQRIISENDFTTIWGVIANHLEIGDYQEDMIAHESVDDQYLGDDSIESGVLHM